MSDCSLQVASDKGGKVLDREMKTKQCNYENMIISKTIPRFTVDTCTQLIFEYFWTVAI